MFLEGYVDCPVCDASNAVQIVIPCWKLFGIGCWQCGHRITPDEIRRLSENARRETAN
jgi:hypothetical protein